ncbi:MAG: NAD(P)H-hydrate dehydratase [Planctomycetota bacterium]
MQRVEELPDSPERSATGHKGTFGRVLAIGGSRGMAGAISLCAQAALHGGAGLVSVATPEPVAGVVASMHPSYMTHALGAIDGCFDAVSHETASRLTVGQDAVAMGPGLGQAESAQQFARTMFQTIQAPLVLDADGLNAMVDTDLLAQAGNAARILTPHPGEFARLTGRSVGETEQDRESAALNFAKELSLVLVLKGADTIVTDGEQLAVFEFRNSALATGGSGDVLTGIIAALLAQGMEAFPAAQLGVHLHGLAGKVAGERYSPQFTTSVEILACLSDAWLQHNRGHSERSNSIGFLTN